MESVGNIKAPVLLPTPRGDFSIFITIFSICVYNLLEFRPIFLFKNSEMVAQPKIIMNL